MPAERYFLETLFSENQALLLEGQEFHHLINVMRTEEGEKIELVNGKGQLANALVIKTEKKKAHLQIDSIVTEPAPFFEMILAQAIPRLNRLDFILEKGTELGVSQFWLFPGELGERKALTDHQLERYTMMNIAAMKQCGRLYLPKITFFSSLEKCKCDYPIFFGDTDPQAPILFEKLKPFPSKGLIFFIGPESGFSSKETEILKKMGGQGVKLHPNILRTDTAALASLALISHLSMKEML